MPLFYIIVAILLLILAIVLVIMRKQLVQRHFQQEQAKALADKALKRIDALLATSYYEAQKSGQVGCFVKDALRELIDFKYKIGNAYQATKADIDWLTDLHSTTGNYEKLSCY